MEEHTMNNPWKGLQSYQETDVIYGRDEEIKALYNRIQYNTQTVVYGKSGIGKSSIINAGIIPRAKHDDMLPVSIRLAHTTKKEKTATAPYVEQIFSHIIEEIVKIDGEIEDVTKLEGSRIIDVQNAPSPSSLWELLHRFTMWVTIGGKRKRLIPLLLFDQFEEIFTLERDNKRVEAFFLELADLLNEVKPTYLTPLEDDTIATQDSPKEDEKEKIRNVFSKIANRKRNTSPGYLDKSEFHLVITLREDFLSYLERYTAYIPIMKQNRFPLLPLNEEQAAKIITEPIRGLVQQDVAEIIIQRVTGRKDFKLDGIPEIEVDAALLSLYMEQLYERKGDDDNIISSELVQYNDDIIKKFYEDSIEGVPEKTINYLEDELLTNANRRNNVARVDLISGGVSEDDLDKLIDKKVLREFSYGDDLRIEFIHDILCPIVNDRIEHREQLAKEKDAQRIKEEEDALREKDRKKKLMAWSAFAVLVIVGLAGLALWLNSKAKRDQETAEELRRQIGIINVNISLVEDAAVKSLWWEARLKVTAKIGGKDSVISRLVDKTKVDSTFTIPVNSDVHVSLMYSGQTRFEEQEFDIPKDSLIKKPIIEVPIKLTAPIRYGGQLIMNDSITNKKYCVKNAMVILNNEVDFTDANGRFLFLLQDSVGSDDEIVIIKKDYGIRYEKLQNKIIDPKNPQFQIIPMELKDMANYFAIKDSCERVGNPKEKEWSFIKNQPIRYIGMKDDKNSEDYLVMFVKEENNRIWGIYNYGKDSRLKEYSYHFFEGRISASKLDSTDMLKYRYFEITSKDIANNEEMIKGRKLSSKNEWEFKIFMHSQQVAESIKK